MTYIPWILAVWTVVLGERLWAHIVIREGCWEWTGYQHERGYGSIRVNGKMVKVHRLLYEEFYGPIGRGLEIDHLCRNQNCPRPDHLEAVTHHENVLRGGMKAHRRERRESPRSQHTGRFVTIEEVRTP